MTFLNLIPQVFTNVKQFNAKGDGSTDDSSAVSAALSSLSSTGGVLFFPPGTYLTGTQTLLPNVHIVGAGLGNTTIKLKNGANADLFSAQTSSINLSAALNAGIIGTLDNFSIRDLTLDGNKTNQSSGTSYPLRFYGYNFILRDLQIVNGYTGGILCDWNGGGTVSPDGMESLIDNCKIHTCNGIGLQMGGPHDTRIMNTLVWNTGLHGFHFAPNILGLLCTAIHPYQLTQSVGAVGCVCEAGGSSFVNCMFEGSDTVQFAAIAHDISITGGIIFGNVGYAGVGLQLGQPSGQTPISGQVNQSAGSTTAVSASGLNVNTKFTNCTNGAINFWNEGANTIFANIFQSTGGVLVSGRGPASTDNIYMNITGLTSDQTLNTTSELQFSSDSHGALSLYDTSGNNIFGVDTHNKIFNIPNAGGVSIWSDNFSTLAIQLQGWTGNAILTGSLSVGQSASAASIASSGTITTSNIGVARVAPTGNVTGIILQAGSTAGQRCTVLNESSFTLTLNTTPATSNVADSATEPVIAALTARTYTWDSSTNRWYRSA